MSDRLFMLLDRAAHAFRERFERACRDRAGVSAIQLVALMHLRAHEGARPGELAGALRLGAAAVTGLVERMVAAGLVRRRPDPDDARAWRLFATASGKRATDAARPVIAAANAALAARFTPDELAVVARFLRAVAELDDAALAAHETPPPLPDAPDAPELDPATASRGDDHA